MKNKELTSTIKTLGTGGQVSLADIQVCVCVPELLPTRVPLTSLTRWWLHTLPAGQTHDTSNGVLPVCSSSG